MINPTPLSPAAQAVLYVTHKAMAEQQFALSGVPDYRQVAAALRAVANQSENLYDPHEGKVSVVRVEQLLAIATELEGSL